MTLDNASNNNTMLKEFPLIVPEAPTIGMDYQIRCFGHILNLAVKAFLSLFDLSAKAVKADTVSSEMMIKVVMRRVVLMRMLMSSRRMKGPSVMLGIGLKLLS